MNTTSKVKSSIETAHANYLVQLFPNRASIQDDTRSETWSDERIRFLHQTPALSKSVRFVVSGQAWLTNAAQLAESVVGDNILELLANLWEKHETTTAELLCGMFSFVVWDRDKQELSLVRDWVGARTVYYNINTHVTCVAPDIKSILQKNTAREIDEVSLKNYLCCAFVPGHRTLWRNIREVRPGTVITLPNEKTRQYFALKETVAADAPPMQSYAKTMRALLEQVTAEYVDTPEPVGIYLSGGIDSSLVAALTRRLHSGETNTYSIHFGDKLPNELYYSEMVAKHIQSKHNLIEIKVSDMWNLLPETMDCLDDPIGDPLTIPNLILGRHTAKHAKRILNGEGGDPCFGGPKNQPMILNSLYNSATELTQAKTENATQQLNAYLASYQKCAPDLVRLLKFTGQACADEPSVFHEDLTNTDVSYLNKLMFINTKFKGADHILTKVNNLTRENGILGLSPLFDQRMVEFSLSIPPEMKLSGATEKAVLKESVKDLLPREIIDRPKSGMMVPVQYWFRNEWNRPARQLLLSKSASIAQYLNQSVIKEWLDYKGDPWARYGVKLWLLVSLELYLSRRM